MPGSDKRDRGSIVVVGLILFVILIGWIFEIGGKHQSCYQVANPGNYSENQQYNGQAEYAEVCTTDYQVFGDTIAQWLMAIFAIAATFVSLYAVKLVRDTFKETERTADEARIANQIAIDSRRAWIGIEEFTPSETTEVTEDGFRVPFNIVLKNYGETPATGVYLSARIDIRIREFVQTDIGERAIKEASRIPMGEVTIFPGDTHPMKSSSAEVSRESYNVAAEGLPPNRGVSVYLTVTIAYTTVGSKQRKFTGRAFSIALPDLEQTRLGQSILLLHERGPYVPDWVT